MKKVALCPDLFCIVEERGREEQSSRVLFCVLQSPFAVSRVLAMLFALPKLVLCVSGVLFHALLARASTHTVLDPGFFQCQECFFKSTPPQSLSDLGLEQKCHKHLTGRPFASLYNTNCQSVVYTALQLSLTNGWGRGEHSKDAEEEINEDSPVAIPALYTGTTEETPSDSPFLKWDALTAGLIRRSAIPLCSKTSGEMYVQSGVGEFNECGVNVLWSAVCCAASNGHDSFSVGLVKEGMVRAVSVQALEELIGISGLFSGGCGEIGGQREEELMLLFNEQLNGMKTHSSDGQSENHNSQDAGTSDPENEETTSQSVNEAQSYTSSLKSQMDLQESSNETENSETGSALLYILSSTISLLYIPFSPIVNTVTNLPSQLTYILQEDMAVLASVPGDSFTLVNNLGSGVSSGVLCVFNTLYQTGELSVCTLYACLSPLANSLLQAFQDGFVGTGTLAWDALGIVTGTACNGLGVGKMVLGSVCNQMVDYLCALGSELGQQVSSVGCGIGTLTWRSVKGAGHMFNIVTAIVGGVVENSIANVQEAFGGSFGESSELQTPEVQPSIVAGEQI
ncbi:uncharacterized protein LOC127658044 isoform X2 [Xyrauchen texanus]|uniref:uncharacterized protein LOC127658044 isoform X2 n=1 Tax=Xyrauchen texanus TaxID=154827 RepID=UPI0022429AA3|nr:uncharacterized protein LOC127658044 isoform X2 [Xyrauchen texanus]